MGRVNPNPIHFLSPLSLSSLSSSGRQEGRGGNGHGGYSSRPGLARWPGARGFEGAAGQGAAVQGRLDAAPRRGPGGGGARPAAVLARRPRLLWRGGARPAAPGSRPRRRPAWLAASAPAQRTARGLQRPARGPGGGRPGSRPRPQRSARRAASGAAPAPLEPGTRRRWRLRPARRYSGAWARGSAGGRGLAAQRACLPRPGPDGSRVTPLQGAEFCTKVGLEAPTRRHSFPYVFRTSVARSVRTLIFRMAARY